MIFVTCYFSAPYKLWVFGVLQTANLDGETNLKIRKAPERTWDFVAPDKVSEFKGFACL